MQVRFGIGLSVTGLTRDEAPGQIARKAQPLLDHPIPNWVVAEDVHLDARAGQLPEQLLAPSTQV